MATSAAPAMNGPWVQEGPNGVSWGYNYQSRNAMGSFNGVPFEMNDASPYAAPMMPYMPTPSPEAFFSGQFGPMMANAMQGAAQGWGMGANPGFNPFSAF
jgi:hypothetical protein